MSKKPDWVEPYYRTPHHDCPICGMPTYLEDLLGFYQLFDEGADVSDIDMDACFCVNCIGGDVSGVDQ